MRFQILLKGVVRLKICSLLRKRYSKKAALTMDTLNPQIERMEYAVRGALMIRAREIEEELMKGAKKPFAEVLRVNIGDCHALGQTPITFIRQVVALVTYPKLLSDPQFPADAKERAKLLLKQCRGNSIGSYTDSPGIDLIRMHVAEYIQKRDGIPSDFENIILSTGATEGIKSILKLFMRNIENKKVGVMIPIPQYPLYSASLTELNLHHIGYYLDESRGWGLDISELKRAMSEAQTKSIPRAIVVINPGNPTGQVLTYDNIKEIIKFAYENNLFILADEVYQYNIYAKNAKFFSFKKVMTDMGRPYSDVELVSFMSASKGYMGESGMRAGYAEIINMDSKVKTMYLKSITTKLCPPVGGQVVMDTIVDPPKEGEDSFKLYMEEKNSVLESLKVRAHMMTETLNSLEGFSSNEVQAAMYAFPSIKLPPKAIEEAKKQNKAPDMFYAFELLENTGICVVPGSGFGQKAGTFHFRTTILPQVDKLKVMLAKLSEFQTNFLKKYS